MATALSAPPRQLSQPNVPAASSSASSQHPQPVALPPSSTSPSTSASASNGLTAPLVTSATGAGGTVTTMAPTPHPSRHRATAQPILSTPTTTTTTTATTTTSIPAAAVTALPASTSASATVRSLTAAAVASLGAQGIDPMTAAELIQLGIPITSPLAMQYFASNPRRPQVHFGNYLLLHTLGEGEFGRVKAAVHKQYGEEVAVKLIRRDRVPDTTATGSVNSQNGSIRPSKIDREINILRAVCHPNIVRLYEVVSSEKYIGIVLDYASGGELFDYILAHKYLREKEACRMFAQLVSGVSYLHAKHIVHRDLKLENLLLDRNRNVIITDFGFANHSASSDALMSTSCGSPCYAAPELVVSDGMYNGPSADTWSCGVILYAMLAGYLPFDDDPANPDSDNINQLYHYILATPLTFPEYVGKGARDLLSKMLVPDPAQRASLEQVMAHPWLEEYRDLFAFSVEDLERAASEQQVRTRQLYAQQMLLQQQLQVQAHVEASNTVSTQPRSATQEEQETVTDDAPQPQPGHPNRHTLQVEYSAPRSDAPPSLPLPTPPHAVNTPRSAPAPQPKPSEPMELDSPASQPQPPAQPQSAVAAAAAAAQVADFSPISLTDLGLPANTPTVEEATAAPSTAAVTVERAAPELMGAMDFSPVEMEDVPRPSSGRGHRSDADSQAQDGTPKALAEPTTLSQPEMPVAAPAHTEPVSFPAVTPPVTPAKDSSGTAFANGSKGPEKRSTPPVVVEPDMPQTMPHTARARPSTAQPLQTPQRPRSRSSSVGLVTSSSSGNLAPVTPTKESKPRISLRPSAQQFNQDSLGTSEQKPARRDSLFSRFLLHRSVSPSPQSSPAPATPPSDTDMLSPGTPALNVATPSTSRRRRTLSMLPGRNKAERERRAAHAQTVQRQPVASGVPVSQSTPLASHAAQAQAKPSETPHTAPQTLGSRDSTSAAKRVMAWFRGRSLASPQAQAQPAAAPQPPRVPVSAGQEPVEKMAPTKRTNRATAPIATANGRATKSSSLSPADGDHRGSAHPSSRATSGTPSDASRDTGLTTPSNDTPLVKPAAASPAPAATKEIATNKPGVSADSKLRYHVGAVDQRALSSLPPAEILGRVRLALASMGIDFGLSSEEEWKLECLRPKKSRGVGAITHWRTSVFPPSQADLERASLAPLRMPKSGPAGRVVAPPSSVTSGSGLKSWLRRADEQSNASAQSENGCSAYGQPSVDGGQEVRFSVEITRIQNLPGLYSLDIRRMRGNVWAYKFCYTALLQRCDLTA